MPIEYNDIPEPVVDYNTSRSNTNQSPIAKWTGDIASGISRDIIKPTIRNLSMQAIDLIMNSIKTAVSNKLGGGSYYGYSNKLQDWTTGYSANASYNPNRFNVNDGFVHNQAVGVINSTPKLSPWRDIGFRTQADLEIAKMNILEMAEKQGYIRVCQFGRLCGQEWDYSLNNYGWYKDQLSELGSRYSMAAGFSGLPFEFRGLPDPIYLTTTR